MAEFRWLYFLGIPESRKRTLLHIEVDRVIGAFEREMLKAAKKGLKSKLPEFAANYVEATKLLRQKWRTPINDGYDILLINESIIEVWHRPAWCSRDRRLFTVKDSNPS